MMTFRYRLTRSGYGWPTSRASSHRLLQKNLRGYQTAGAAQQTPLQNSLHYSICFEQKNNLLAGISTPRPQLIRSVVLNRGRLRRGLGKPARPKNCVTQRRTSTITRPCTRFSAPLKGQSTSNKNQTKKQKTRPGQTAMPSAGMFSMQNSFRAVQCRRDPGHIRTHDWNANTMHLNKREDGPPCIACSHLPNALSRHYSLRHTQNL